MAKHSEKRSPLYWVKWLAIRLVQAAAFILFLIAALVALLQTPYAKRLLAEGIERYVSAPGVDRVSVDGIGGIVPFDMYVGRVALYDGDREWLRVEDAMLRWSPWPLLNGHVRLRAVTARRVAVQALPRADAEPEPDKEPWRLPEMPQLPAWLTIDNAAVAELLVSEDVLPEPGRFALSGYFRPVAGSRDISIGARVQRLDRATTHARAGLVLAGQALSVDVSAVDSAYLPDLLNADGPFELELMGSGLLSDWQGGLWAKVGPDELCAVEVSLIGEEATRLDLSGDFALHEALIPKPVRDRLGRDGSLNVRAALSPEGRLEVNEGRIETPLAAVAVSGSAQLEERVFQAELNLDYADARRLLQSDSGEAPEPIALRLAGSGEWQRQQWEVVGRSGPEEFAALNVQAVFGETLGVALTGDLRVPAFLLPDSYKPLSEDRFAVRLDGAYDTAESVISVEQFSLDGMWAQLEGSGTAGLQADRIDVALIGRLRDANRVNDLFELGADGTGTITADIQGDAGGTNVQAHLALDDVVYHDARVASVEFTAEGSAGPWRTDPVREFSMDLGGNVGAIRFGDHAQAPIRLSGRIVRESGEDFAANNVEVTDGTFTLRATGQASPSFDRMTAELNANVKSIQPYARYVDQAFDGALRLDADATYTEANGWDGRATAELRDAAQFPGIVMAVLESRAEVRTSFRFDEDRLTVDRIDAETPHVRVDGGGAYDTGDRSYRVDVNASAPELSFLSNAIGQPVQGQLSARLSGDGALDALNATLNFQADEPGIGAIALAAIEGQVEVSGTLEDVRATARIDAFNNEERVRSEGRIRFADSRVTVDNLTVTNGQNRLVASGAWDLDDGPRDLTINATLPELTTVGRFAEHDLAGRANASVTLAQSGDTPALRLQATGAGIATPYGTAQSLDINGDIEDPFSNPRGQLQAVANEVGQEQVQLARLRATAVFEPERVRFETTTDGMALDTIPFDASLRGDWSTAERILAVEALEGRLEDFRFALRDTARLAVEDERVRLEPVRLTFGDGEFNAQATWSDPVVDIEASWENLPLEVLRLVEAPIANGAVSGRLAVQGELSRPHGSFALSVRDAQSPVMAETGTLTAALNASATFDPQRVDAEATASFSDGSQARVTLALPLLPSNGGLPRIDEDGPWEGSLSSQADLSIVPRLLVAETYDLSGRLTADVSLAGSVSNPRVQGAARIAGARYENSVTGTILEDLTVELAGDNQRLALNRFAAADGAGGQISADGGVTLDASAGFPFTFETQMQQARLVHRDDVTGRVDGSIRAEGSMNAASVTGALTVTQSNIVLRPAPSQNIPELQVVYADARPPEPGDREERAAAAQALPPTDLDVSIEIPGRAFVIAQDVQTEWQGDFHVGGTIQQPEVSGTVQPVRGYIGFLGRRFTLQRESTITIDTKESLSPYLNLTATTRRDNLDATLTIRGTLDELDVDLISDPPLPQEEVLARVLFGRNLAEITPVQAFQLARAVTILSGKLEGVPFFSGPSRLPVIDTLDIETGEEGPVVSVGKYLADNVFVELEQGTAQQTSRARVEFEVTPHISLETSLGANAQGGVGVLWKYDY